MAIKDVNATVNAGVTPVATAPTAPVVPTAPATPATEGGAKKTVAPGGFNKEAEFRRFKATGTTARQVYDETTKALEGSASDSVQFIIALSNPARSQKRVQNKVSVDSHEVVGYKFKALKDIKVPTAHVLANAKTPMECEEPVWSDVPAGTEFFLNLYETGLLISQVEYGGCFNGGGDEVVLHATFAASRGNAPLTVIKRKGAPIKDKLLPVADVSDVNGKKVSTVKAEYSEKFGYLYVRSAGVRTSGGGTKVVDKESEKDLAAAFRQFTAKK